MTIGGKILITGGAGFLGRGIMRQAAREQWACEFSVYSRDEYKQHRCRDVYPQANYMLGDIRDTDRLTLAMRGHDVVIHAGALKYVPESERNVDECIGINVVGTQSVVRAAWAAGVKKVVFISTDKAVEPYNTYGMTKALAERVMFEAAWMIPSVSFTTCRYGNVIGSTGSVVPVFKKQLELEGEVRVTHPDMTRFWLTVDQAVHIIELALIQKSGTITVPRCAALRIGDIADAISPGGMHVVGLRPGEKMHEKLLTQGESLKAFTDHMFDTSFAVITTMNPTDRREGYEWTSDQAEVMPADVFMQHVADAETV